MAFSRYYSSPRINFGAQQGVSNFVMNVRSAIKAGTLPIIGEVVVTGLDRLDALAGSIYGDAKYWWVLAAASDIGWGLQVPPGTVLNIVDISQVKGFSG
jgi:hypothetical protein